ncbi:MAG: hypothetical protein ACXWL2_03760 [Candidatus Chromulinivorax sp.]
MIEQWYTISIALPIVLTAIGTGIGQGLIGVQACKALNIQPQASTEINRITLVAMSLTETSAILGLVISILLLLHTATPFDYFYASVGRIGLCLAVGVSGLVAGIVSSKPAQAACMAVARQPFFSGKILQLMLLTQTVIMTPNIFGFLIALLINAKMQSTLQVHPYMPEISNLPTETTLTHALQLLTAGIVIGFGSISPCIGLGNFAAAACNAIGSNRKIYNKIMTFTFICEAIIETPIIFSLLTALLILNATVQPTSPIQAITFIAAALCMSLSTIGTGLSAGKTASAACKQIEKLPEEYNAISQTGLLSLTMIDTFAIFGFIISIILIYAT